MADLRNLISAFFICLALSVFVSARKTKTVYGYWDPENGHHISAQQIGNRLYCVAADHSASYRDTGWDVLNITTQRGCSDETAAYTAGLSEAYLTYDTIYMHWYNTMHDMCDNRPNSCEKLNRYLETNTNWIKSMVANHSSTDPYWYQMKLFYLQLQGLTDGYHKYQTVPEKNLTFFNILTLNLQGDLEDLLTALNPEEEGHESMFVRGAKLPGSRSCSALVKLLPNSTDLYTSHDTWSSFQSMLRTLKRYNFNFLKLPGSTDIIPGRGISFSSYPGEIQSGDDFYITSAGLVIMETTIGNDNASLWSNVHPEGQVLEQIRTMVTNRLATNGRDWAKMFSIYNSGTYNNQWMVVDYKLFKAGTPQNQLKNNLLWVLEQLPGYIKAADKTDTLREQSYWPSYNIAYFPEIYNISEQYKNAEKYGDWFTYDRNPRALMFKRDHVKVNSTQSMIELMRYIDYKHDPLSRCNCTPPYSAENTIACRSDLNPANGTYPFATLGHRSHAATDMKLTTAGRAPGLNFIAISGPPFNSNTPPFQWSTSDFKHLPHLGHNDIWLFKPVEN